MHYIVLAYPNISEADYQQIQDIRKTNDRQYSMVDPHFTLVFPATKPTESELLTHVESIDLLTRPFSFTLTKAIVKENVHPKHFQVHLIGDEPIAEIVKLHDLLYADLLASELRADLPYTAHITVASDENESVMQKLADEVNAKGLKVKGQINSITVSSFDGRIVTNIKHMQLASATMLH